MEGDEPTVDIAPDTTASDIQPEPAINDGDADLPKYTDGPPEDKDPVAATDKPADSPDGKPGEPEKASIPDDLLDAAEAVGFNREEIRALGSKAAVETMLKLYDSKVLEYGRSMMHQQQQQPQQQAQQQQQKQPQAPQRHFDPEKFDENLVGFEDHVASENQAIRSETQAIRQELNEFREQIKMEKQTNEIDSYFNGLDKENEALFGKGDIFSLAPGSLQHTNRNKVAADAIAYRNGLMARGIQPPSMAATLEKFRQAEFGKRLLEAKHKQEKVNLAKAASKASATTIARPTQRRGTGAETDPEERAKQRVRDMIDAKTGG